MVANLEPVVFAVDADSRRAVATAARRGNVRRVATGVYTVDVTTPIDRLVPERLHEIIGLVRPGAHLCGRTAALGGLPTADGDVFVVHSALRPVSLAGGVTVRSAPGTLGLESDLRLPGGITMSSEARLALENLVPSRSRDGRLPRTLGRAELKEWIDRRTAEVGESWAEDLLRDAETVSAQLGLESEFSLLRDLVGAAPATQEAEVEAVPPPPPRTARGLRRTGGRPFRRVAGRTLGDGQRPAIANERLAGRGVRCGVLLELHRGDRVRVR